MIWMIGVIVGFLVGLILVILTSVCNWAYDWQSIVAWTLLIVCLFGVIGLGIASIQSNVSDSMFNNEERLSIEKKLNAIENDYVRLVNTGESGDIRLIDDYNTRVASAKYELAIHVYHLTNPWVNWFTSKVWLEYADRVEALQYFTATSVN